MKQTFSKHPLKNIVIIFMLPVILLGIMCLYSNYRNIENSKTNMNATFSEKLTEFTELNKKLTNNIFQDFSNITLFSSIKGVLQADSTLSPYESKITDAQSTLRLYKQNNPMINSVCLVNRSAHFVVTESGIYSTDEFFGLNYKYNEYDTAFWSNLRIVPSSPKLLDSSEVTYNGATKIIIPYVCTVTNTAQNASFIIVNLDLEYIYGILKSYSYTPNSKIFMMNNTSFRCLSASGLIDFPFNDELLKKDFLKKNFSQYSNIRMDKTNYYVMVASSTNSLYNFSYIVCVPNQDITNNTSFERTSFLLTLLIEIIIFALALLVFILKVYIPLNYINQLTKQENASDCNVLAHIIDYIHMSSDNITMLEGRVKELLPSGIQNYLCNLLKGSGDRNLNFEKISFRYNYYLPVSVEIVFNTRFYEDINMPYLSAQVIDIIYTQFEMNHQCYSISKSATTLSLLINLQDETSVSSVNETVTSIQKLFIADTLYISVYIGAGFLISDLSELSVSFEQCKNKILSSLTSDRKNATMSNHIFGNKESTQFINYLTNGNTPAALQLLDAINSQLLSTPRNIVQSVYSDVLYNLHRIMRQKGLSNMLYDFSAELTQISEICSRPQNEIYDYALQCISQIDEALNIPGNKLDIEAVIQYIRNHFAEDLSLDFLAEKYGTYPQYLSKRIKQSLGFTFHDYLSSLRVEKAKDLLATTNMGISEIGEKSGFISRNTFLRVFKKNTGIPPSEYRTKSVENNK